MMVTKAQWEENAIKKYGSIDKAKEAMRQYSNMSSRNSLGKGGFAKMDKDKLRELSRQAARKRWSKE